MENITEQDILKLIENAYREGYDDGQSDGSRTTGCRGCYDHDPLDDVESAWNDSETKRSFDTDEDIKFILACPDFFAACKHFVKKCDLGLARSRESYCQMSSALKKAGYVDNSGDKIPSDWLSK